MRRTWILALVFAIASGIVGRAVEGLPGRLPTHPVPIPRWDDPPPKPSDTRIQR